MAPKLCITNKKVKISSLKMEIITKSSGSYDADGIWFEDTLSFATISSGITDENESVKYINYHFARGIQTKSDFITNSNGYIITTELGSSWGLGTSSTLINNIAQWLQIDALRCLKQFWR
jgi:hypothetical protein